MNMLDTYLILLMSTTDEIEQCMKISNCKLIPVLNCDCTNGASPYLSLAKSYSRKIITLLLWKCSLIANHLSKVLKKFLILKN